MRRHTAQQNDESGCRKLGNSVDVRYTSTFRERRWLLLIATIVAGLAAVLVIIASIRPNGAALNPAGFSSETTDRSTVALFQDASKVIGAQSTNLDVEKEPALRAAKEEEERRRIAAARHTHARGKFKEDYPMVPASRDYYVVISNARSKKLIDLTERDESFWNANKDRIFKMVKLNKELSRALTMLDMVNSEERVGFGTVGEVATTVFGDAESFEKIKQELAEVVTKHLHDSVTAAQITNASDLKALTELASRSAPGLRAIYLSNLGQVTADPEWRDLLDDFVVEAAFAQISGSYEKIMIRKFGKEYGLENPE
jgi:hypothetical protein